MKRLVPTRFHGTLDYIAGSLLIASPWLLDFSEVTVASWTAVVAGVVLLIQTVFTHFETGVVKKISVSTHLMLDVFIGVILAGSPWPFGFSEEVFLPHLIFGLYLILSSFTTHRVPGPSYREAHPEYGNAVDFQD